MAVILSVEDNEINQFVLTERLTLEGYDVLQAFDEKEATMQLESEQPISLILLDIGLPNKDGISIAAELRASQKYHAIPIFFLTAHATEDYRQKATALGINDFFTKPIDFDALLERVNDTLRPID